MLGTTGSVLAAVMSYMGSTFPDSSEYMFFGKRRNRYHRRYTAGVRVLQARRVDSPETGGTS